jgi:hemoglobin
MKRGRFLAYHVKNFMRLNASTKTGCLADGNSAAVALERLMLVAIVSLSVGCGTAKVGEEDKFFTSGSREADQRASQRMARHEQLSGEDDGGSKVAVEEDKLALYDRLGGEQGIAAIVEDFTRRVIEDPRVNWSREGVKGGGGLFRRSESVEWEPTLENVGRLKRHLAQFLSLTTGGPPRYEGKGIEASHADMRITNAEFDAAIGDLKASLDRLKIANAEQKELLAILESTRPQIVTER